MGSAAVAASSTRSCSKVPSTAGFSVLTAASVGWGGNADGACCGLQADNIRTVDSVVDKGSNFTVVLPSSPDMAN